MNREARLALHHLAEAQKGLFSAAQAAQLSIDYRTLSRAVAHGYVRRSRPGVYAISGGRPSKWEPMLAAALSVGPSAVVSHSTAACVHRLWCAPPLPDLIEITVPPPSATRLSGTVVHRRAQLPEVDIVDKHGIKVTSAPRTLVDLAARLSPEVLARTIDEGFLERYWDVHELLACLGRAAENTPGRRQLGRLLHERLDRPVPDSHLEIKMYQALRPLEPYEPHYQVNVGRSTYVLDAAWPARRVAAEIVGRRPRAVSKSTFDRERRKLNALAAAGWRVAHLPSAMSPTEVVGTVRALLELAAREAG